MRGWPQRADRAIPLPIPWVHWIDDGDSVVDSGGRGAHGGHGVRGGVNNETGSGRLLRSDGPVAGSSASGKVFVPTNQFADRAALQRLKESFARQPNWKAAVMEGKIWEGNADKNAAKLTS